MKNSTSYTKKHILIIGVLLSLICVAYGQYNPPPQHGDYRNIQNVALVNDAALWQMYDGTNWVAAPHPLTYYQPAFTNNIYAAYNMVVNVPFTMGGNIYSPNAGTTVHVAQSSSFTLASGGTYELRQMVVSKNAEFINRGTVTSKETNSRIALDDGPNMGEGGVLENHGSIQIENELYANSFAKVISKKGATIHGPGKFTTNMNGVRIEIANTDGYNGAIALSGDHSASKACFVFNGDEDQVTGNKLPDSVFSIDIMGGQTVTLSKQVNMWGYNDTVRGDPYVRVHGGSTLDTKSHIISSIHTWGDCDFFLDSGATIVTANPNGISSNVVTGKINSGAIRTNNAVYSSGANYIFSGTPGVRQNSGNFTTSPDQKTVNTIINESTTHMLKLDNTFRPLNVTTGYWGNINTDSSVSGEGYVVGNPLTLPVTLSYFNAFFNGFDSVVLQWETQSETNNLGFYVLRSSEPDAALANVVSGLVPAANSSQGAVYYFEDAALYDDGIYYYWLQDVSFTGEIELHGPCMAHVTLQAGSNHAPDLPLKTSLVRNYPNPFNPSTQLEYYLEEGSDVSFEVYNLKGQKVDQFNLRNQDKGFHRYTWKPQLGSGTYLIKFTANGRSNTRKVVLTK